MSTLLTEDQQLLRAAAREFLSDRYPMTWVRAWIDADPAERAARQQALWADLASMGWLGLLWPEEYGGSALGFVEQTIVLEELGRSLLPSPYLGTLLGASIVDRAASPARRGEILGALCRGERTLALAVVEDAGGDAAAFTTRVTGPPDEGRLTGTKRFVPDAPLADRLLVAASSEDGEPTWLWVDAAGKGVGIEALETMDATRPVYDVTFDGAAAERIGDFAPAWAHAQSIHWTALAAEAVGGCEKVLADTVAYAKDRVQFGVPIGANQAIKHKCSNMLVRTEAARAITYHAARTLAAGDGEASLAASMAKAYATEAYREVAADGIQIHGGVGFTWEFDCHFFYKRARAGELTAGHPDEHRERVAAGAGL